MSALKEILNRAKKREFADLYESVDTEARDLLDAFVDRVLAEYPEIKVYPTDKPDLRFELVRVAAAVDLKKRVPYLRLNLLKIPTAIQGTRLEFRKTTGPVLETLVVVGSPADLDDAMRYMERSIANARQS